MNTLTGLGPMLRLAWRRDRIFWLCWIVGLVILMPMTARMYDSIIPPGTDPRATLEPLRTNPSMLALLGPAFDIYNKGGFVFWRVGGFVSIFAGMMTGFGILRATRSEEENGRLELLRSGVLGRHAPLAAGVLACVLGSTVAGLLAAGLNIAVGLEVPGSFAAGAAILSTGLIFTGIGAICAQVFENSRAASGWTLGVFFAGMYVARMIVDGSGDAYLGARWAIPMEWGMLIRPYADERWWVLALPIALTVLLVGIALTLESRRDQGAGLKQSRPGRAHAAGYLSGVWGLAWRLQRGGLIGWTLGLLLGALGTGQIMSQLDASIEGNPQLGAMLEKMGGTSVIETAFYLAMLGILGSITAIMAVIIVNRLRVEENRGQAEVMLATATSRWSYALSNVVWAVVLPSLVFIGCGALLPLLPGQAAGDYSLMGSYTKTAALLLPGLLLIVGFAVCLVGWLPRLTGLSWALLGWTMFTVWFAELFDVPKWLLKIQPWGYLAHPPRDEMDWTAFSIELAIAVALLVVGLIGYRRRNIPA